MKTSERTPPAAIEIEAELLGACLRDCNLIPLVQSRLTPESFYSRAHRLIWRALLEAFDLDRGRPVDLGVVHDLLTSRDEFEKSGGMQKFAALVEMGNTTHAEYYLAVISERARMRRILGACWKASEDIYSGAKLDSIEAELCTALRPETATGARQSSELVGEVLLFADQCERGETENGVVNLHWPKLNRILAGLRPGHMIVVAGRPSMGKTSFAMNIAIDAARKGNRPAIFSLEMSARDLGLAMLCTQAGLSTNQVRRGILGDKGMQNFHDAGNDLGRCQFTVDDSARSLSEICGRARIAVVKEGAKLVIVDYIQLIAYPQERGQNREQVVSMISKTMKNLAGELHVPLILLAQLNRSPEARQDKRPLLSDLRESGSIEQDADEVILLHRPSYYSHKEDDNGAEVIIAKQRQGRKCSIRFVFLAECTRFEELRDGAEGGDRCPYNE